MATIISPFLSPRQKYEMVKEAIEQLKPLSAVYSGSRRLLCPYILGEDDAGEFRALFFQFGRDGVVSARDASNKWRCLPLDKLSEMRFIDERWRTAPPHDPRSQTCMKTVHVKV